MIIRGATSISRLAVIFTVFVALTACSDGGGSSFYEGKENPPSAPDQSVSLEALTSTAQGLLYSSSVTASDSDGLAYTGSIVVENQAQTLFDGVLVTPRDTVTFLKTEVGSLPVTTETSQIDDSGYLVSTATRTAGQPFVVTCIASSPAKLPESVNIGDSGALSTLTCDNNTILDSNWKAESAGEGSIGLVISTSTRDQSNVIVSTVNTTYTLDSSGNIVSYKSVTTQSGSGFELTVQSI